MKVKLIFILLMSFSASIVSASENCLSYLKYEDKGNPKYAWLYVNNKHKNKVIHATIKNSWAYNNERRSEIKNVKLSPGDSKNVLNFDRSQKPKSEVAGCHF